MDGRTMKMEELYAELNASPSTINLLKIRLLCRENPGLISNSKSRVKIWTLLLLGSHGYFKSTYSFAALLMLS